MKKWYSSVSAILVMAAAVQLTGCASTSRTFARWTGRDKDDQQVAEIDGKAAKDTAAKSRSEARRPATQASKSKPAPSDDDRIVAKTIDPKAEAAKTGTAKTAPKSSATPSSSGTRVAAATKSDETKRPADTAKADKSTNIAKADTVKSATAAKTSGTKSAAAAPKAERSKDPFAEFEVAADESVVPPLTASKSLKTTVNPAAGEKKERVEVDPGFEEFASGPSTKQIQEVAHRGAENELPEWAMDSAPAKTTRKSNPAGTQATPPKAKKPAVTAATTTPTVAEKSPSTSTAKPTVAKESYSALCPGAKGEVRELVRSLDVDDLETVKRSIHRLGRLQRDAIAASPALEKLLLHRDSNVRVHAALALVRMNEVSPFVTETLILALRSPDPSVRSFSAAVLSEMGPNSTEALPALSTALRDSDGFVRLHVAEVLIRHDDFSQAALDTLLKCLKDEDENVRWLATYSLAELAPQSFDATAALERSLSDASPKVCVGAAYALGEIGPMARSATNSLQRCAKSKDPELQAAVAYALRQVAE